MSASPFDRYQRALNGDTGYRISCHEACADGCRECDRLHEERRSEAVGADYERYDSDGMSMLRWFLLGFFVVLPAVLLGAHFLARSFV